MKTNSLILQLVVCIALKTCAISGLLLTLLMAFNLVLFAVGTIAKHKRKKRKKLAKQAKEIVL